MALNSPSTEPAWLRGLSSRRVAYGSPAEASAVCHDSRTVVPGAVFVAIPGFSADGNGFISDAIARGARAVVVQENLSAIWEPLLTGSASFVAVPDARIALAEAAAAFYGYPGRTLGTIGVTGTDGKTTTTHLIARVLNQTGLRCGHLSSVEFGSGGRIELNASHMTTLEADAVQRYLAQVRGAGDRYAAIEASSIGLDLHRVDLCEFDVGVFTNLSPDHLDYHKTMDSYRDAKAILFGMLSQSGDKGLPKAAVLNHDDAASVHLGQRANVAAITYGLSSGADITADEIEPDGFGTRFVARRSNEAVRVRTRLLGDYNVSNCLAAVGVAVSQGVPFDAAVQALESFDGVPGRMELIDAGQPFRVVVDIASTEQSMRNVLRMLRPLTPGRIIVVFGAAGERDPGRRSGIANAVAAGADAAIVTNEDPRSEDPQAIANEITRALKVAGFGDRGAIELDRRSAIARAFADASRGDTVLLAGKGTEQSIVIGSAHVPWDERRVARELLEAASALDKA